MSTCSLLPDIAPGMLRVSPSAPGTSREPASFLPPLSSCCEVAITVCPAWAVLGAEAPSTRDFVTSRSGRSVWSGPGVVDRILHRTFSAALLDRTALACPATTSIGEAWSRERFEGSHNRSILSPFSM